MTPIRQRMTEDMQVRNLSPHTQASYVQQISLFARYFNKSPEVLGPEEVRAYQVYLTNEKKLTPSSILIAVAALRFLYKVTLHKKWAFEDMIPAPKKPNIARCPQSGRGPAVSRLHTRSQTSHDPHHLLRGWSAYIRGRQAQTRRYR